MDVLTRTRQKWQYSPTRLFEAAKGNVTSSDEDRTPWSSPIGKQGLNSTKQSILREVRHPHRWTMAKRRIHRRRQRSKRERRLRRRERSSCTSSHQMRRRRSPCPRHVQTPQGQKNARTNNPYATSTKARINRTSTTNNSQRSARYRATLRRHRTRKDIPCTTKVP